MKYIPHRLRLIIRRTGSASWAASFLFFLVYSAPHQVHHFFEQSPNAHHHETGHEHSHSEHNNRYSTADCVCQASVSRCHLGLAWQITPASMPIIVQPFTFFLAADHGSNFLPTAFQIRAPPAV